MAQKIAILVGLSVAMAVQAQSEQKLMQLTDQLMKDFNIPAITLAVKPADKPIIEVINRGVMRASSEKPVDNASLYQIGSVTKTFTAYLIKQAVDQHRLVLSDKLTDFLPQYKHWRQVTVGDLVNQTSGIVDYDHTNGWWQRLYSKPGHVWTSKQLIGIAYRMPLHFKPGSHWQYSNTNYVLLGELLSVINHKPYAQQLDQLLMKFGLLQTHYAIMPYSQARMALMVHGYYQQADQTMINGSWLQSAGGLISNPRDLVKWYPRVMQQTGMQSLHGYVRIPNAQRPISLSQMAYSYAVFRMNTPAGLVYFTPGLTPGYVTGVGYIPCSQTYFAFSAAKAPLHGLQRAMMMALLQHFNANKSCPIKPAKTFTFPPFD